MTDTSTTLSGPDTMNAPWGLASRHKLVVSALWFFDVEKLADHQALIGKGTPAGGEQQLLNTFDFLRFLEIRGLFSKPPNGLVVARLLDLMAAKGLLTVVGNPSRFGGLDGHYLTIGQPGEARRGALAFVSVLGPELLYHHCKRGLVHVTGRNGVGDAVASTGIVVAPRSVLTCRHVVSNMEVDSTQTFQGKECQVNDASIHCHPSLDIAVLQVQGPSLAPLTGAVFRTPIVDQTVHTLGYPRLPGIREATIVMQPGRRHESVSHVALRGPTFLYSAISRPGNSGGAGDGPTTATSSACALKTPLPTTCPAVRSPPTTRASPVRSSSKACTTCALA